METVRTCLNRVKSSSGASPKCGLRELEHLWGRPRDRWWKVFWKRLKVVRCRFLPTFLYIFQINSMQEVERHRVAVKVLQTYQTWQWTHFVSFCHSSFELVIVVTSHSNRSTYRILCSDFSSELLKFRAADWASFGTFDFPAQPASGGWAKSLRALFECQPGWAQL